MSGTSDTIMTIASSSSTKTNDEYDDHRALVLGVIQLVMGILCIFLQIWDIAEKSTWETTSVGAGIWCGLIFVSAGASGIAAGAAKRQEQKKFLITSSMVLSAISVLFTAAIWLFCLSEAYDAANHHRAGWKGKIVINLILMIFALVELVCALYSCGLGWLFCKHNQIWKPADEVKPTEKPDEQSQGLPAQDDAVDAGNTESSSKETFTPTVGRVRPVQNTTTGKQPSRGQGVADQIMISYSWEQKAIVDRIHSALKRRGYKVWRDVEKMHGGLLGTMAKAVENSALLLICYSADYRKSDSCEREASFAREKKIPRLPVLVQKNYTPDGWLGVLVAGVLHVDCTGDFSLGMDKIMKQLELHNVYPVLRKDVPHEGKKRK